MVGKTEKGAKSRRKAEAKKNGWVVEFGVYSGEWYWVAKNTKTKGKLKSSQTFPTLAMAYKDYLEAMI